MAKTFMSVEAAFAYYTECALATVEGLPKRVGSGQAKRLTQIADDMVGVCRQFQVPSNPTFTRLARALARTAESTTP